jgi:hypothetical protein
LLLRELSLVLLSITISSSLAKAQAVFYYAVDSQHVFVWDSDARSSPGALALNRSGHWEFEGKSVATPELINKMARLVESKATTVAPIDFAVQKMLNGANDSEYAPWQPRAELYLIEDPSGTHRLALIAGGAVAVAPLDSELPEDQTSPNSKKASRRAQNARSSAVVELLQKTFGDAPPRGFQSAGSFNENQQQSWDSWLHAQFTQPLASVPVNETVPSWIFVQTLDLERWKVRLQRPSYVSLSPAETVVPSESVPMTELLLGVGFAIALGLLFILWRRTRSIRHSAETSSSSYRVKQELPLASIPGAQENQELAAWAEKFLSLIHASVIAQRPFSNDEREELDCAALNRAQKIYKSHLGRYGNTKTIGDIKQQIIRDALGAPSEEVAQRLYKLGLSAESVVTRVRKEVEETPRTDRWPATEDTREWLPQLFENWKTNRLQLVDASLQLEKLTRTVKENQDKVNNYNDLARRLEKTASELDTARGEGAQKTTHVRKLESELAALKKEIAELYEDIGNTEFVGELSKVLRSGKRDFLYNQDKEAAAAALAFLTDYSLLNLALNIVNRRNQSAAVMRGNLRRICEAMARLGFEPFRKALGMINQRWPSEGAIFREPTYSDGNREGSLFQRMLGILKVQGQIDLKQFDFDVDEQKALICRAG